MLLLGVVHGAGEIFSVEGGGLVRGFVERGGEEVLGTDVGGEKERKGNKRGTYWPPPPEKFRLLPPPPPPVR